MSRRATTSPRSIDLEALDERGDIFAWQGDFWIALNHIVAFKPLDFPLLAAAETDVPRSGNWVGFLFRNSGIGYTLPNVRVNTCHVEKAFFRSAHLRSPGRIENTFANESFIDELAFAAQADPAEYRLRYMKDPRCRGDPEGDGTREMAVARRHQLRHGRWRHRARNLIDRPDLPTFAVGEPTPCAIPAAIGNAVFDATGARLREVPFTPDRVKAALVRPLGA